MSFARPILLYALFALPFVAVMLSVRYRRLFPLIRKLSLEKDTVIKTRYFYSGLFGLLTFAALAAAAAGPTLMVRYEEERSGGMDIVFAFDVSRSMNVRDVVYDGETISRLEGAQSIANALLTSIAVSAAPHTDYRYAVAVGKGEGVLAIPLTYGTGTVRTMIDALSSQAISAAGTNVEKLTLAAMNAFPPALSVSYPAEKRIIVFTDGEALSGQFQDAVEKAAQEGITVTAVCIGSEKGGPIPVGVPITGEGVPLFLRDTTGKNIVSKAEPGILKEAVLNGGGLFVRVEDRNTAVAALEGSLSPQDGTGTREAWKKKDMSYLFTALALLFFALHKYTLLTRSPRYTRHTARYTRPSKIGSGERAALPPLFLLYVCVSCVSFTSCSSCTSITAIEAKFRLLEGNFYVARDMPHEAEERYTRARSLAGPEDIPYTLYALAFVQSLYAEEESPSIEKEAEIGENGNENGDENENGEGAVSALLSHAHTLIARETAGYGDRDRATLAFQHGHGERHRELAYRIHYNAGIAYYNAGKAEEAAWEFRQALLVDSGHPGRPGRPSRIEAKRNLEISLALLENKNGVETNEVKSARPVREGVSRGNSVLFDFIRQKETDRWKSWAWQGEDGGSSPDY